MCWERTCRAGDGINKGMCWCVERKHVGMDRQGGNGVLGRVYVLRGDVKGWRGRRGDRVLRVKYGVASRANEV